MEHVDIKTYELFSLSFVCSFEDFTRIVEARRHAKAVAALQNHCEMA